MHGLRYSSRNSLFFTQASSWRLLGHKILGFSSKSTEMSKITSTVIGRHRHKNKHNFKII